MIQMRSANASSRSWVRMWAIVLALAASVAPFRLADGAQAPLTEFKAVRPDLLPRVMPVPAAGRRASPVLNVLKANPTPLSQRQIFAVINNQATRVDDQVAAQVHLTAEIVPGAVVKTITAPTALAARFPNVRALTVLPTLYTATVTNGQQAISFNVALTILDNLHYDGATKLFLARIFAVLINPANTNDDSALAVELPVSFQAENAESTPTPLTFQRLHDGKEVVLKVTSPTDPYPVRAVTAFNLNPDPINLSIDRPTILIKPVNNSILGFGLGSTGITISVTGTGSLNGEVIGLSTTGGTLKPGSVTLAGNSATTTLLSGTLGSATITGQNSNFDPGVGASVTFGFPLWLLVATILGGLVGTFLRHPKRAYGLNDALVGVGVAIVVVIGNIAGIQIGGLSPTDAGVGGGGFFSYGWAFAAAAIAGIVGRTILDGKTTKR